MDTALCAVITSWGDQQDPKVTLSVLVHEAGRTLPGAGGRVAPDVRANSSN